MSYPRWRPDSGLSAMQAVFAWGFGILFALLGLAFLAHTKCERQWARSGMKAEWALLQGCMVQRKDGTWIPATSFRETAQ